MRTFSTGATRDDEGEKLDYEGFLHPEVLHVYAEYMHEHRRQGDGAMRAGDNWQKGIPPAEYMRSLIRHTVDLWRAWRRGGVMVELCCAILFNTMGLLHELLVAGGKIRRAHDD